MSRELLRWHSSPRKRRVPGAGLLALLLLSACRPPVPNQVPERSLTAAQSGYSFQSPDTQALQDDPFANPGFLWIDKGRVLFQQPAGKSNKACADCHGADAASLKGAATRYPAYSSALKRLINIEQRINRCRTEQQAADALPYEADELLALTTFVVHQSEGLAFAVSIDGPARPFFEAGRDYYYARRGQLNLACHHCHEYNAGRMLRGDRLSQGHSNGYPGYRLEWQSIGSLHRRLRFCNTGVRAEPFDYGAAEYVNLELFLAWRAAELPIETPAVRR